MHTMEAIIFIDATMGMLISTRTAAPREDRFSPRLKVDLAIPPDLATPDDLRAGSPARLDDFVLCVLPVRYIRNHELSHESM